MGENDYYSPITLNEFVKEIQRIIRDNEEVSGEELITNAKYVTEDNCMTVPTGSILLDIRQNTMDPDVALFGTLAVVPKRAGLVM